MASKAAAAKAAKSKAKAPPPRKPAPKVAARTAPPKAAPAKVPPKAAAPAKPAAAPAAKAPASNIEAIKAVAIKAAAKGAMPAPQAPADKDAETTQDSPLLDLSDAAVRKMIKNAKKRGYVTYEQLNAVMPSEEVTSEQIEDTLSMLSEMGINVIEQEDAEASDEEKEDDDDDEGGELVEVSAKPLVKSEKEPSERTDDPVRMYLREMGSVELLSREGEIAIAKRIEAGREAMIAGLCE